VKLRYFAWVRERIGIGEEEVALPATVRKVSDLLAWLKTRGPEYEHALVELKAIRVAIDQVHAPNDRDLSGAHEIALFPPMTGG